MRPTGAFGRPLWNEACEVVVPADAVLGFAMWDLDVDDDDDLIGTCVIPLTVAQLAAGVDRCASGVGSALLRFEIEPM